MGKIFYLMGKSASGKDSLHDALLKRDDNILKTVVLYTTRPIRSGETEGVTYHYVDEEKVSELEKAGRIIELRCYETVHGPWKYFTVDDGQINLKEDSYLMIGTLESYVKTRAYFGAENMIPLYITVPDDIRLERALNRERLQKEPKYAEMCRRFLADEKDFSVENLKAAGIEDSIVNLDFAETLNKLNEIIRENQ